MCQEFGQLPNEGGVLDQDHLWVRKLQMVLEAQQERRQLEREKAKRKTPSNRRG